MRSALFLLMALMALMAVSARADLVRVGETEAAVAYLDSDTVSSKGPLRKAWVVLDFKQGIAAGSNSSRVLAQFSCEAQHFKMLQSVDYSGSKAEGSVVRSSSSTGKWSHVAPDTAVGALIKAVCASPGVPVLAQRTQPRRQTDVSSRTEIARVSAR